MAAPVVVVGGSAGALEPLRTMVAALPVDLPAAVVVVVHTPATSSSRLAWLLGHASKLEVATARDGNALEAGHVFVAPPDEHVLVEDGHLLLSHAPRENGVRPAIDPLFRSVARAKRESAIAVVLCGMLDDGSAGLASVRAYGGTCVVLAPDACDFGDMPENAIRAADPQHVVGVDELAPLIVRLVEDAQMKESRSNIASITPVGQQVQEPSEFACPDCGGVLSRVEEQGISEFRCRVGHRYSPESLVEAQASAYESAVWAAVRALEEQASLARDLHERALLRGDQRTALRFAQRAATASDQAAIIRERLIPGLAAAGAAD